MALIKCPDCGKEFSSMAKACPQCGCPVEYCIHEKKKCLECGMENDSSEKICANCACPLDVTPDRVEEQPKDKGMSESIPLSENTTPNNIEYDKIFYFAGDEFDESKMVGTQFALENATKIIFPQPVGPHNPYFISIKCLVDGTRNQYLLSYNEEIESVMVELLETAGIPVDEYGLGGAFKGAIITIDGTETIKLADVVGNSYFILDREQVIACCNANSIKFKLFRTNGISFTIEGTEENTRLMIDAFKAMYHYIEDKTMYGDSLVRLQRWYEKMEEEEKEEERQEEAKKAADETKKKTKKTIGIILIIIGSIIFLISLVVLMPYYDVVLSAGLTFLGMILAIVGAALVAVARVKKFQML